MLGPSGCYICVDLDLPLPTLLSRPSTEAVLYFELLGNKAPLINLQALIEGFQGVVLRLSPAPPLKYFIINHSFIVNSPIKYLISVMMK